MYKKKYIKLFITLLFIFGIFYFNNTTYAATIRQGKVTATAGLRLRSEPNTNSSKILTVPYNSIVRIEEDSTSGNGCSNKWVKAVYESSVGYLCSDYLEISEVNTESSTPTNTVTNEMSQMSDAEFETYLTSQGFPETYKVKLRALHKIHPTWIFIGTRTNRTWANAMYEQDEFASDRYDDSPGNSFLNINPTKAAQGYEGYLSTQPNDYDYHTNKFKAHDGVYWFQANSAAIAHYMDPRKYLTEYGIFSFQDLSYDSSYQTEDLVKQVLGNNHLTQFSNLFIKAAQQNNTSPIYLAALARQEVGTTSTNICSNGQAGVLSDGVDYTGYYNFYNIGASSSPDPKLKSLQTAKAYGWNSAEKAIVNGAYIISNNYIQCGQHTLYYQKFNFSPQATKDIWHQYTTNIDALESQSISAYNSYSNMGVAELPFKFDIPIFDNMPDTTPPPALGNPNNYLSNLMVNGLSVTNFDGAVTDYVVQVARSEKINVGAVAVASTSTISGTGQFDYTGSGQQFTVTVRAANGATRDYHITVQDLFYKIGYSTHIESIGWETYKSDGIMAGTSGRGLRVEALKIELGNVDYQGDVEYKSYIEGSGWESTFKKNGEISGTTGKSLRIEAIQAKLTGEIANHYDIYYRVHVENFGWLGWAKSGEKAGSTGYDYRMESMQILLVEKDKTVSGYGSEVAFKTTITEEPSEGTTTDPEPTTDPTSTPDPTPTPEPDPTPEIKIDNVIQESGYKRDGLYMSGIALGTNVETLINNLKKYNSLVSINIKDKNGNVKSSGTIGTGDKIEIDTSTEQIIITAIIYGDLSGDGEINALDLLKIQKHILDITSLDGAFFKAADINKDNDINALDLLRVQKHILGTKVISQD